jgi:hypothetical protein
MLLSSRVPVGAGPALCPPVPFRSRDSASLTLRRRTPWTSSLSSAVGGGHSVLGLWMKP